MNSVGHMIFKRYSKEVSHLESLSEGFKAVKVHGADHFWTTTEACASLDGIIQDFIARP